MKNNYLGRKMAGIIYKNKISKLITEAKKRGLVQTYSEFCKNKIGKKTSLVKEEIDYYVF